MKKIFFLFLVLFFCRWANARVSNYDSICKGGLLAMADLSKTVEEIKHQAAKDTGELQFNEEHNTDTKKKPITTEWENEPEEKKDMLSYIVGAVLIFIALLFFYLKRKKRKK